MFTLNGQLIVDLTALISDEAYAKLDREITFGLARSTQVFHSPGTEFSRGDAEIALYDHSFKDVGFAEAELTPDELSDYKKLSFIEQQRYLRFAKGAFHPWAVCLPLTRNSEWPTKMSPAGKEPWEEAEALFPLTLKAAYSLKIFQSVGRVCIFGSDPNQHVTCHRDDNPATWPVNDEFIMLTPRGARRFYVYDPETKTKHFTDPEVRAYAFHDLNYHGCEALPYFNYSIRIDGIFTPEFRSTIPCNRKAADGEGYLRWQEQQAKRVY